MVYSPSCQIGHAEGSSCSPWASCWGEWQSFWFSLPLWLPWVLEPLARSAGARYARYERQGYRRFSLHDLTFTNQTVRLHAQQVEGLVPTVWLWRCLTKNHAEPFLRVEGWQVQPLPASEATGSGSPSVYEETRQLEDTFATLRRWLPVAALSNGALLLQTNVIAVPSLNWSNGQLDANIALPGQAQRATLNANLAKRPVELRLDSDTLRLHSTFHVSTNASGLTITGESLWWSNRVTIEAQFGRGGELPERASLKAQNFRIPSELLRLEDYPDLSGSLSAQWQRGAFGLDLDAGARPLPGSTSLPPIKLALHAYGDTNSATVQTALLTSPWLRAELSQRLNVNFTGPILREPASFRLAVDLTQQPWFPLTGNLTGEADFSPSSGKFPLGRFELAGADIGNPELKAGTLSVKGSLNWPWLEVSEAAAAFDGGSAATLSAKLDLRTNALSDGHLAFQGPLLNHWLPHGYSYQGLALSGTFSGPLDELRHEGKLEVTNFISGALQPLQLRASWSGREQNLERAEATLSTSGASLSLHGSLALSTNRTRIQLTALTLSTNEQPALTLEAPVELSFGHGPTREGLQVDLTPLDWVRPGRTPPRGRHA